MSSAKILDCTLRDGGYINKWKFGYEPICGIVADLTCAGVDIIECGFLRDVVYDKDSSVFSCVSQIPSIIAPKHENTLYVAMIALGDISVDKILPYDGSSIDGIRLTFHKHEWSSAREVVVALMGKGYKVFVQPVGTTSYSDTELIQLILDVNKLQPYAFYLVDTLGILYRHDLLRLFYLIDHNLDLQIKIGFHSHNNLQMSFANTQELLRMNSKRDIIIDATVYGMGRGVGNLSTELLAEYINANIEQRYNIIPLLSIADKYLMSIYSEQRWGYDLPYFLSAVEKCHPDYAAYLLKKETLNIQDISKLLSLLPLDKRDLYNCELIEQLYLSYQNCQIDDSDTIELLRKQLKGKDVLILAPGASLNLYSQCVQDYIDNENPYIISTNFLPEGTAVDMIFISNRKRLDSLKKKMNKDLFVVATSNLTNELTENVSFVNYAKYLGEGNAADNVGALLIRLLNEVGVKSVALAGFDGFYTDSSENYCVDSFKSLMDMKAVIQKNKNIARQLKIALNHIPYKFITPTRYEL